MTFPSTCPSTASERAPSAARPRARSGCRAIPSPAPRPPAERSPRRRRPPPRSSARTGPRSLPSPPPPRRARAPRRRAADGDERRQPRARRRAPARLVQRLGSRSPSSSISPSTATRRRVTGAPPPEPPAPLQRARVRVVGVVHDRHAAGQPGHLAAVRGRPERRRPLRHRRRAARRTRRPTARAGQRVHQVAAAEQRHAATPWSRPASGRCARIPSSPRSSIPVATTRRRRHRHRAEKVTVRPTKPARARHHQRIVGVGDQHGRCRRTLEDLGLRVGNRVDRVEELAVHLGDVRPDAHVGLGDLHQRLNFARVVHPELDDRHFGAVPQFEQGQRQADVVVQVPARPHDPVPQPEERRRNLLRRRLARAARDRHHAGAGAPPHPPRQRLQRPRGVGGSDEQPRPTSAGGNGAGGSLTSTPLAPAASAASTKAWPSNRSPRIAT